MNWHALAAAQAHDPTTRVAFHIGACAVGSVAVQHLAALRAWPGLLEVSDSGVRLVAAPSEPALATINHALREQGLVRAWRDEAFAIVDPDSGQVLTRTERAAARFWGTLTFGAHANGYVAGDDGRPTHLWVARRAMSKATDPGLLDNLVGGGVPDGQTPHAALLREGWEEAGLPLSLMQAARPGSCLRLRRDIPEGLQVEDLHVYDLALPADVRPCNQDGEVAGFDCLPLAHALALAAGSTMTVDASLATLDFALRHGLLPAHEAPVLSTALGRCVVGDAQAP